MEARHLIDDVAELCPPIFILSGADPLKRQDIYELVRHAAALGLHPFLALSATPLLTPDAIAELKHAGLSRLILNLDAATPELHDIIGTQADPATPQMEFVARQIDRIGDRGGLVRWALSPSLAVPLKARGKARATTP